MLCFYKLHKLRQWVVKPRSSRRGGWRVGGWVGGSLSFGPGRQERGEGRSRELWLCHNSRNHLLNKTLKQMTKIGIAAYLSTEDGLFY